MYGSNDRTASSRVWDGLRSSPYLRHKDISVLYREESAREESAMRSVQPPVRVCENPRVISGRPADHHTVQSAVARLLQQLLRLQ